VVTSPADLAPAPPRAGVPPCGRGRVRGADLLLAVVVAVQALATVAWPQVVTIDGPAHLAGAAALLRAGEGPYGLYLLDWSPVPNMLTTLVLAALLPLLGPDEAERLLVLGYLVGLPLAARYALRGVHPAAGWQALVAVPFAAGYLHAYGFTNFNLALAGFLVAVGVALRRRSGWSRRSVGGLGLVLLLTWSAHLLPTLVAGIVVAVLAVCRVAAAPRSAASRSVTPRSAVSRYGDLRAALVTHLLPPAAAGLPVLALTAWFTIESAGTRGDAVRSSSLPELVLGLVTLGRPLVAWTTWEYVGSVLIAAGLLGLAVLARREGAGSPERVAPAVSALLLTAWYLASPDRYGHEYGFLNDRLSYFPPLLLLLWAAQAPPALLLGRGRGRRPATAATAAVIAGTLALVVLRLPTQVQYSRDVAELMSVADAVPQGSTLVPLRLWRDAPVGPDARNRARDPLRHTPGRIAVLREAVNVGHYEAATPYFPVRFRPGTDPRRAIDPDLTGLEQVPPRVDLTRGPEVVLLVGRARADAEVLAGPRTQRLLDQLEELYERTEVSQRSGLVEVWRRRA
jgi:hypothetical protein